MSMPLVTTARGPVVAEVNGDPSLRARDEDIPLRDPVEHRRLHPEAAATHAERLKDLARHDLVEVTPTHRLHEQTREPDVVVGIADDFSGGSELRGQTPPQVVAQ
jgi:hypothetical protein